MNPRKYNRGSRRPRTHRTRRPRVKVTKASGCLLILVADLAVFGGVMYLLARAFT